MELDGVTLGSLYTKNALGAAGLMASPSFLATYRLVARQDLSSASAGVIKDTSRTSDTSEVYQVKAKEYKTLYFTASYSASQTAADIIAAPGAGKKIVITYLAFRSSANTGTAYLEAGAMDIGTTYFEAQKDLSASDVFVECPTNTKVTITTTTATAPMTVGVLYHIEEV